MNAHKYFAIVNPTEVNQSPDRGLKEIIQDTEVPKFVKEYFEYWDNPNEEALNLAEQGCEDLTEYTKLSSSLFGDCSQVVELRRAKYIFAYEVNGEKYSHDTRFGGITVKGWEDYYFELLEKIKSDMQIFVKNPNGNYGYIDVRFVDGVVKTERYGNFFDKNLIASEGFYESEDLEASEMFCEEFKVLADALTEGFGQFDKLNKIEEFFESIEKYKGKKLESILESEDELVVFSDGLLEI